MDVRDEELVEVSFPFYVTGPMARAVLANDKRAISMLLYQAADHVAVNGTGAPPVFTETPPRPRFDGVRTWLAFGVGSLLGSSVSVFAVMQYFGFL